MKNLSIRTMALMASMAMAMNGSSNDGIERDIFYNETNQKKKEDWRKKKNTIYQSV